MNKEKRNIQIDYNRAVIWYQSNDSNLKELALLAFPELAKSKLPKTWEELGGISGYWVTSSCDVVQTADNCETVKISRSIFKTEQQAEASIALAQLSQLRDIYRNGWLPDWLQNSQFKYLIVFCENELVVSQTIIDNHFLSFQSIETAEDFLNNFKELIEKAKPLMS